MRMITLAARKGGCGKTLLTASLAVLACQDVITRSGAAIPLGARTAVIDLDPQGCLTGWRNRRAAPYPAIVEVGRGELDDTLAGLAELGIETVLVDTPPGHGDVVTEAVAAADLVIVPTKPGELDLEAAMKTISIAERLGTPFAVLPNDATFRSRAMGAAIRWLDEAHVPRLSPLHHRVDLLLAGGLAAPERAPASRAAGELAGIWAEVKRIVTQMEAAP